MLLHSVLHGANGMLHGILLLLMIQLVRSPSVDSGANAIASVSANASPKTFIMHTGLGSSLRTGIASTETTGMASGPGVSSSSALPHSENVQIFTGMEMEQTFIM